MSKGPGKVQRRILAEVERTGGAFLVELRPADCTKEQYDSLRRAATLLCQGGQLQLVYCCGRKRLWLISTGWLHPDDCDLPGIDYSAGWQRLQLAMAAALDRST